MDVINRYLYDPNLEHNGNAWFAQFDGWGCNQPTAMARQYGYWTSCMRGATDEIQVKFMADSP
jgi:hypothetical protein